MVQGAVAATCLVCVRTAGRAVQWSGGSEPAEVVGDMRKEAVKAEILFSGRVLREKRDAPPAVVCPTLTWHLVHEPTYCP